MKRMSKAERARRATHRKVLRARLLRALNRACIREIADGPTLDRDVVRTLAVLQRELDNV
jgi:hypothetical protein